MRVAIDEVRKQDKLCEGTICYTNDVTNPMKKYTPKYYLDLVKDLENAGANIIAIKDMADLLPNAIKVLVKEIKNITDLPIIYTHDTSGTYLLRF